MQIYIPTFGRSRDQVTFHNLPPEVQNRVNLLVDWKEAALYDDYPHILLPSDVRGIGKVRQWAVENSEDKFVMLDDDLTFATRRDENPTLLRPATGPEIYDMFEHLNAELDQYKHVGVASREGANRNVDVWIPNTRMLRILGYSAKTLLRENIRFDRIRVMEDFDVALQLLERGYPSQLYNWMTHNQKSSNAPGGCSSYRTMEVQAKAAHMLQVFHPEYVTLVQKKTKTAWNGQERWDVRIAWKKAYRSRHV